MKRILLIPALSGLCLLTFTQAPQGINYQSVLYNSTGSPVTNATIQVSSGILSDTITPVILYEEIHSDVLVSEYYNKSLGYSIRCMQNK